MVSDEKLLYKINIRGWVQGVGFRWSAAHEAWNRGIKGYVKNMSDGSVYIEAEGPESELIKLLEYSKKGPQNARVDKVEFEYKIAESTFKGFEYSI